MRRAESLGYRAAYVDGDVSVVPSRGDAPVLEGWTATVAHLARTERIEIGSIRLVHQWNVARFAQAVSTLETIAPERLRVLVSIGAQVSDRRFGYAMPPARVRVEWLDEWVGALRQLLSGEDVTLAGRHVQLDRARIRPVPRGGRMPIEIGGARPALLGVIARHADRWDLNLPPIATRVDDAVRTLERAAREAGRDPGAIGRSMWILVRPGQDPHGTAVRDAFRRWQPWFRDLADAEIPRAVVAGPVGACRDRIAALRARMGLDLPVLDLVGLDLHAAAEALEALAGS